MLKGFLLLTVIAHTLFLFGQDDGLNNTQEYTPSVLLEKGEIELKNFNNIYTQTQGFDKNSKRFDYFSRATYFTSINQIMYGTGANIVIGAEVWVKSVRIDTENSSPFGVLSFGNDSESRTAITNAGVKIKFNPIKKWENLSVQSSFLFSTATDPESLDRDQPFLDSERHLSITQLLYDKNLSDKFQLFTQFSAWVSIDKNLENKNTGLALPLDVFISYLATDKFTFYLQNQFWPSLGSDGLSSYFIQEGLGVKYQLFSGFELEALYSNFIVGKKSGAGQTFNVGVRILR